MCALAGFRRSKPGLARRTAGITAGAFTGTLIEDVCCDSVGNGTFFRIRVRARDRLFSPPIPPTVPPRLSGSRPSPVFGKKASIHEGRRSKLALP